jgi:hypothetical protein
MIDEEKLRATILCAVVHLVTEKVRLHREFARSELRSLMYVLTGDTVAAKNLSPAWVFECAKIPYSYTDSGAMRLDEVWLAERAHAEGTRRAMSMFRKSKIARASLAPEHGCIAQTGRAGHHSLWLRREALKDYFSIFQVAE